MVHFRDESCHSIMCTGTDNEPERITKTKQHKINDHNQCGPSENKKLSWCWQTCTTRL